MKLKIWTGKINRLQEIRICARINNLFIYFYPLWWYGTNEFQDNNIRHFGPMTWWLVK